MNATPRRWRVDLDRRDPAPLRPATSSYLALVGKVLRQLETEAPAQVTRISISLVGDGEMRELNREYRGKDKPTDVLSFANLEGPPVPGGEEHLGDLVISVETARRQAVEYGVTFTQEMARLTVHGILHLLGYDHERVRPAVARRMRRREDELLEGISRGRAR